VPIRVAAVALTFIYIVAVISRGYNAGGDAAHLAGMAAGACYVLSEPWRARLRAASLQRRTAAGRRLRIRADRVLQKVHERGIGSLTAGEKRILKRATKARQDAGMRR
jgi:hypothetical protein